MKHLSAVASLLTLVVLGLFQPGPLCGGELTLSNPTGSLIYQRDDSNRADVVVSGQFTDSLTSIEARLVPMDNPAADTPWKVVSSAPAGNSFNASLGATGGWYQLQVRGLRGTDVVNQASVSKVGVGEVFIVAGQSNSANLGEVKMTATDDRVLAGSITTGVWTHAADPVTAPLVIGGLNYGGDGGSCWPLVGDKLVQSLDVPVGFVSVGVGASAVYQWEPNRNIYYSRLADAIDMVKGTGFRAILWHQGEADSGITSRVDDYASDLKEVIAQTRIDAGFKVPWAVSLVSYTPRAGTVITDSDLIAAQQSVIDSDSSVIAGPYTDVLVGDNRSRSDGVHFTEKGLTNLADLWTPVCLELATIPEPSSLALLMLGSVVGAWICWRRRV